MNVSQFLCIDQVQKLRRGISCFAIFIAACLQPAVTQTAEPTNVRAILTSHCVDCHNAAESKGNLNLDDLAIDLQSTDGLNRWISIHDRVAAGEMPPKESNTLPEADRQRLIEELSGKIQKAVTEQYSAEGRATRRRLNRYEYENTLRDLFDAPWLQIRQSLPEDGEAYRFNKVGDALDVSHVQIARYMAVADEAMQQVIDAHAAFEKRQVNRRYYARDSRAFYRRIQYTVFNRSPERATFPIVGFEADLPALEENAAHTVGEKDPQRREREAMGVVASTYEPLEIKFDEFKAPISGAYRLRFSAYSFWARPESEQKWWRPSRSELEKGRTREPVSVYAEMPPRLLRKIGNFEVTPEPNEYVLEVNLLAGETIRPDAVRLFRSRPPGPWRNPLAVKDGQPGVAFRWLEVEGPIHPSTGGALRPLIELSTDAANSHDQAISIARREIRTFLERTYRRPVIGQDVDRFIPIVERALANKSSLRDSIQAAFCGVLCSPEFITLNEEAGTLNDYALASRLSYFLWNSEPDRELRKLASEKKLHESDMLDAQAGRLLESDRSQRFVDAFLDYWLDLRKADATSPDADLYPDYYLDDYLVESSVDETRSFFKLLIDQDLPARNLVDSDFVVINERLALHYELPGVEGVQLRKVALPEGHVRGGLLTQASILKITANGTTTSPVTRGVWMTERILGKPVPPPPAAVPAVEPDTRGATTIRQQLDKHRTLDSCNACHARIDPPGFALESFDVLGGFRSNYRVHRSEPIPDKEKLTGNRFGKNGQPFTFDDGPVVDASGSLSNQGSFHDIKELQSLLLKDERQIARNLVQQLVVYATGAPVRFTDRSEVERILDTAKERNYGVKSLILALVQSRLFREK